MFRIDLGEGTRITNRSDPADSTVSEALETLYRGSDARVDIYWNAEAVSLRYWGGISDLYGQIVQMFREISGASSGTYSMNWLSSNFTARWNLAIRGSDVVIDAAWTEPRSFRENEFCAKLEMNRESFLGEWALLLKVIEKNLCEAGYDENQLEDLGLLRELTRD